MWDTSGQRAHGLLFNKFTTFNFMLAALLYLASVRAVYELKEADLYLGLYCSLCLERAADSCKQLITDAASILHRQTTSHSLTCHRLISLHLTYFNSKRPVTSVSEVLIKAL